MNMKDAMRLQNAGYGNPHHPEQWRWIALSAQVRATVKDTDIEEICRNTLQGRTEDEPDLDDCCVDIILRGYHVHKGTVWGLMINKTTDREWTRPDGVELYRMCSA